MNLTDFFMFLLQMKGFDFIDKTTLVRGKGILKPQYSYIQ